MRPTVTRALVAVGVVAGAWAALSVAGPWLDRVLFPEDHARFESVQIGMTESDVRARLGVPYREYTGPRDDYYVDGYSFKRREIRGKVLIYIGIEHVAYVYLDPNGRTEEVHVGGS